MRKKQVKEATQWIKEYLNGKIELKSKIENIKFDLSQDGNEFHDSSGSEKDNAELPVIQERFPLDYASFKNSNMSFFQYLSTQLENRINGEESIIDRS